MQIEKITNVNCCARIRDLCDTSGRSQKDLARLLDLSEGALINYKRDRIPKAEELYRIANFFGTTMDYLYGGTGGPQRVILPEWQSRAENAERKVTRLKKMLQEALAEL